MGVSVGFIADDESVGSKWAFTFGSVMLRSAPLIDDMLVEFGTQIARQRNALFRDFLTETESEWLWMVDTDHVLPPDTLRRMYDVAVEHDVKVLGAATPIWVRDARTARLNVWEMSANGRRVHMDDVPRDALVPCLTGGGCLLVHREVIEATDDGSAAPWFRDTYDGAAPVGEDFYFVDKVVAAGYTPHVHTGIQIGHTKTIDLFVDDVPQPRPIVAVIPTIDRTEGLRSVVDALAGNVDDIVVIDNGATGRHADHLRAMADNEGVVVVRMEGVGIHKMWNKGVEVARKRHPNPHVLFVNDDVRLGERVPQRLRVTLETWKQLLVVCPTYDDRPRTHDVYLTDGICAGRYDGTGGLAGFCFMVDGAFLASGWRFPEEYRWWFGDNILVEDVVGRGGKVGVVTTCTVSHPEDALSWLDPSHPRRDDVLADMRLWEETRNAQ